MSIRHELEGIVLRLHPTPIHAQRHAVPFLDKGEDPMPVFVGGCGWLVVGGTSYRVVDADGVVSSKTTGYYRMLPHLFKAAYGH